MNFLKEILRIIVITLGFLCAGMPANAFNVSPFMLEIDASPGQSYIGTLSVTGKVDESVRIYLEDWDMLPDSNDIGYEPGTTERSCSDWLSLSPTQFDVPANGRVSVKYSFTVPEDAAGSYWAFIMVEGAKKLMKPSEDTGKVQVMIETKLRYAVRLFINVETGSQIQGEITGIDVSQPVENSEFKNYPLQAKVVFHNTCDILLKPQGFLEIRDLDGETITRTDIPPRFYVIPGRERWLEVPIETRLRNGEYLALAVLDYGGESLVAGEAHFSVQSPPEADMPAGEGDTDDR